MRRVHKAIIIVLISLTICVFPGSAVVVPGITITANPDPVVPGNQLTYTIIATNANTATETASPTILFFYDPNLDYLSGSPLSTEEFNGFSVSNPAFWSSVEATETNPGRIVEIAPGGSYSITVITRIKPETPCGTPITSTARIDDPGDGGGHTFATAIVTTATTCGIPAPEFPSAVIPVTILAGLAVGILAIRARVK
jgi:hypothetical protein